ncbi:MAG: MotA/TolQ/ExbB proton channel family protein [Planctomycetaceae bacterium]
MPNDRTHDSYSLLQTITWAVPIVGFLGTVMGITLAIANVTPEQLDTSLPEVTGGLAVAFDTTAVALSESILLVFGYFYVKRSELRLLGDIEEPRREGAALARRRSDIVRQSTRPGRDAGRAGTGA